jgi:CDP-diacylglycerol--serine O-phosphatidyltransferase
MHINHSVKRALPNFFTFGSMMCGFFAVVSAVEKNFEYAAWFIIIAAVADALDGVMARLTNTASQFGVELDSISDVISFGFAPAFVLLVLNGTLSNVFVVIACLIYLFAGGFRLARFNAELVGFSKEHFKGLPIPSAAITVSSFLFLQVDGLIAPSQLALFSIILALGLAFLMTSRVKYETLPGASIESIRQKPVISAFLALAIVATLLTRGRALFYIFLFFILYGILRTIIDLIRKPADFKAGQ